ncbi:hypothetical protein ABID16_003396 [Rhizobium aquaticum]|uniref:Uncharacterized protein n=1 Tax=Rhizobium aquaticum TaxID=1549636 RepID=A0ABV2J2U1_9HYPH
MTALVLYDHLQAARRLGGELIARTGDFAPAVDFLVKRDETHGFISNHLATAAAALLMWDRMHGDTKARNKAVSLIDRIVGRQSAEGWFDEYGGADPGYQTLCMTHLAEAAQMLDSPKLWLALERACDFLAHFAHPDGSFGGIYGSRATRIYYPAGMELLAARFSSARALAEWMRPAIARKAAVTLAAIDAPNLSPVFNNYCEALLNAGHLMETLPSTPAPEGRHIFPDAGLVVDRGAHHYSIISTRKSVIYHWRDGKLDICDSGLVLSDDRRQVLTSQGSKDTAVEMLDNKIILHGTLAKRSVPTPNPYNFLVLRFLTLSIMRIPWMNGFIKTMIARLLVQAGGSSGARFRRTVTLGMDLSVSDDWEPRELKKVSLDRPFSAIHMASSGYWQRSDTELRPK